jgi:hypothetical protein
VLPWSILLLYLFHKWHCHYKENKNNNQNENKNILRKNSMKRQVAPTSKIKQTINKAKTKGKQKGKKKKIVEKNKNKNKSM